MKKRQFRRFSVIVAVALMISLLLSGASISADTTTSVYVQKVWATDGYPISHWPDSVTVQLYADGVATGDPVVLNASNSWTHTWTGLDVYADGEEITYTVDEPDVPDGFTCVILGDADVGFTVTNTFHTPLTSVSVNRVVWDDGNNQDGLRPDSVTVQLYADGVATGDPVVLSAANRWAHTWMDVYVYANGERITYTVDELNVPDGYTCTVSGTSTSGFTITNSHTPETTSVSVTKAWNDGDNQDGLRPDSVTVQLYADGEASGDPVVLSEDDDWTYTWTDLDVYADGEKITYTVEETDVPDGYTSTVSGDSSSGFTITNSLITAAETTDSASTTLQEDTPITGDSMHDSLYAVLLLASTAGLIGIAHRRRKHQ